MTEFHVDVTIHTDDIEDARWLANTFETAADDTDIDADIAVRKPTTSRFLERDEVGYELRHLAELGKRPRPSGFADRLGIDLEEFEE